MDAQLALIYERQAVKYRATIDALRGHLRSLAATREDRIVSSDDAVDFLNAHGIAGDRRLIGPVFAVGFRQVGYGRSRYRRGMNARWTPV